MDTGIISSRYARALLKFVGDAPDAEVVYDQVKALEKALGEVPRLEQALSGPESDVGVEQKMDLLRSAAGSALDPRLEKFLRLVLEKGRIGDLRLILHSFEEQYLKERHILIARLVTAVPAPELQVKLSAFLQEKTGCEVRFETEVNPDLIGGFTLEVGGWRADAAVSSQLDTLCKQLVRKNRRIV